MALMKSKPVIQDKKPFFRSAIIVVILGIFVLIAPDRTFYSFDLFNPKRIFQLIFALALVQALGSILIFWLGVKAGSVVSGFLSGLVSSTATTAALAKKSQSSENLTSNVLVYLSANMAMLTEALLITFVGSDGIHISVVAVIVCPMIAIGILIVYFSRADKQPQELGTPSSIDPWSLVKLVLFIFVILLVTKFLQIRFGQSGIYVLTGLVSLFEIHGSMIANTQIHNQGILQLSDYGLLVAISMFAALLSKLGLVTVLAGRAFKLIVLKLTFVIWAALLIGTIIFAFLSYV